MATYKLIQDIEAEDHILGPLTLRQFIFALIAIFLFYICFILVTKHAAFLLVIFLPPALFFGFFALPFGRDQPTEIWALAKLRFWFKPRKRLWNQSGVKELVTITVPKKIERVFTDGLSQSEVRSRLTALASTIDSRGWAVKNVNLNAYNAQQPVVFGGSDRLVDASALPQAVPETDIVAADDILDPTSNPIAQQFDAMIAQSSESHRQQLMSKLSEPAPAAQPAQQPAGGPAAGQPPLAASDYWFMGGDPLAPATIAPPQPAALTPADEAALASELKSKAVAHPAPYGHMRTVQPLGAKPVPGKSLGDTKTDQAAAAPPVTAPGDPAILSLANNDDLNVATLAREAQKAKGDEDSQDEVVISLR
jgi:hypothetical protein